MANHLLLRLAILVVFSQAASAQCEIQRLTPTRSDIEDFGFTVALAGEFAVVGTPYEDSNGIPDSGAAFVFKWTPSGWVELTRLFGDDPQIDNNDWFGYSVAISKNTILVGAPQDTPNARPGSAYVFQYDGTVWTQTAKLTPSGSPSAIAFGNSVALADDRAIIGAHADNGVAGAAYIFVRGDLGWFESAKLTASDGQTGDHFGSDVSLSEGYALVGAPQKDVNSGAAYVFDYAVGWSEVAKLIPSDSTLGKLFGSSVSISGTTALLGAYGDETFGGRSGSAYVFERTGTAWIQAQKLYAGDEHEDDYFGWSVAVAGNNLVVGAPADGPGSTYVFNKDSGGWAHAAVLASSDATPGQQFGTSVALDGEIVLVGANGLFGVEGAGYVFQSPAFTTAYCFGVGCPCGNDDGVRGCANSIDGSDSFPQGALLAACGSGSAAADDLVLTLTHLPPNQFGLFYMGGGELQAPFGDGLRCVGAGGAGVFRFNPPQHSGSGGMLTLGPGVVARSQSFAANGHIDAGETWYFQGWYRDPIGPCGTAFNLSNGLAVTFAP